MAAGKFATRRPTRSARRVWSTHGGKSLAWQVHGYEGNGFGPWPGRYMVMKAMDLDHGLGGTWL